ncbi:uncharacterized protein LOC126458604 isoform X1 [Schistocerca serialis cubense]|uniref:uncharacterized protein LOC126458604 isoform X1 n=1 Tax=Schistocerca serialis cubense TaxID=2023355 RepID=UPI00214E3C57|nr:uncharacterized protein LOC126458604 isoform X1 [Schistocerca serialis cubense]
MPPQRKLTPPALEELCMSLILSHLEQEINLVQHIRTYQTTSLILRRRGIEAEALQAELAAQFDSLPPLMGEIVRQSITNRLFKNASITGEPRILVGMLDVILNKDVRNLNLSDPKIRLSRKLWPIILKKCTGLERFELGANMLTTKKLPSFQSFVSSLAKSCPYLTELILKEAVIGSGALSTIGYRCQNLRVLDISGSKVTCIDMLHLCLPLSHYTQPLDSLLEKTEFANKHALCKTMEILCLGNTQVKVKGAAFVLRVLPYLTSLGNFVFTAAGLKRIYGIKTRPKVGSFLKQVFYRGPSNVKLKVIANCCPNLENLFLGSEFERRVEYQVWNAFEKVRTLTLENIIAEDITAGMKHFSQLVELQLASGGVDLGLVAQCCPLLEKLTVTAEPLRACTIRVSPIFPKLKDIKVTCPVSLECGSVLLRSQNVTHIDIVRIRDLTDSIFSLWLRRNPMTYLKTLLLGYVELTRKSAELLLDTCPQLTRLGYLGSWDIRSWECRRLKERVVQENYDVHLLLYSRSGISGIFLADW